MAEQDVNVAFEIEIVPDVDFVFLRAHRNLMVNGLPGAGVFTSHEGGMSVDWSKYATPEQSKFRAKKPDLNAVLRMNVGHIRAIPNLDVLHTPIHDNQSHCDVPLPDAGEDLTEVRFRLKGISKVVLPLESPTPRA